MTNGTEWTSAHENELKCLLPKPNGFRWENGIVTREGRVVGSNRKEGYKNTGADADRHYHILVERIPNGLRGRTTAQMSFHTKSVRSGRECGRGKQRRRDSIISPSSQSQTGPFPGRKLSCPSPVTDRWTIYCAVRLQLKSAFPNELHRRRLAPSFSPTPSTEPFGHKCTFGNWVR